MAKNDVAVKNEGAVALVSTFEQDAMGGFDGMDQEDYALPFLRLLTNTKPRSGFGGRCNAWNGLQHRNR